MLRLPAGRDLALGAVATLFLGVGVSGWRHEGHAERYAAVTPAPALIAAATGAGALTRRTRLIVVGVCSVAGLPASAQRCQRAWGRVARGQRLPDRVGAAAAVGRSRDATAPTGRLS